jgi:hypothetical protein
MIELTENECDLLDHILTTTLKDGFVTDDLLPKSVDNFIDKFPEVESGDYSYYLSALQHEGIVKVEEYNANGFRIEPIAGKTERFIDNGGFRKQFDIQKEKNKRHAEIDNLTFSKLKWEAKLSKFKAKTFWPLFLVAIFGGLYSSYDFIAQVSAGDTPSQNPVTVEQLEKELSILRSLIIDTKSLDSLKRANFKTQEPKIQGEIITERPESTR